MNQSKQINKLNRHQIEILKLFTRELDDNDLIEIKKLIVRYLGNKITQMADEAWDKNEWTNEEMDRLLKTHKRTHYESKN